MRLSDESAIEGRHLMPEERIALQAEEIMQLRAQVARVRETLEKAREVLRKLRAYEIPGFGETCEALAEIDKAIGGKEDAGNID